MSAEVDLKKCLMFLKAAKTDTEKFAALLVVSKLVKSDELDSNQRLEIFNAIGHTFLKRLLHANETQGSCTDNTFRSIGLNILAGFCSDPQISVIDSILDEITLFKEVITSEPHSSVEETMIDDALQCILGMTLEQKGQKCIFENKIDVVLVDIYVKEHHGHNASFHILLLLAHYCKSEMWLSEPEVFTSFMTKLSCVFCENNSSEKFQLCQMLTDIFLKTPNCRSYSEEFWCIAVRKSLFDILKSRLSKELRDPALKLASVMVEKFGSQWFLEESDEYKKFFSLLVNLACVEVRMTLEDRKLDRIDEDIVVLTACYSILETTIAMMVEDNTWHCRELNTEQLFLAVKDAFSSIVGFLRLVSEEWETWKNSDTENATRLREVTYATFRILCCWLAEETLSICNEIYEILPFLIQISKDSFYASKEARDEICDTKPFVLTIDILRFMLPALCHLSADDCARKILLAEKAYITLFDYLQYQWVIFFESHNEELAITLSTLCGIFLNITVLESKFVSENDIFFSLLKFLFNSLPQLAFGTNYLQLRANFAVLGLLLAGHYHKIIKSCETIFYKFLSSSVKFMWDAHHVEDACEAKSFVLVREYRKCWHDIMELWFLGMQALSSLLSLVPWISTFLIESGWPQHITSQLSYVSEPHVEGSIKTAYQHFLCCVVKTCPEAVLELKNFDIAKVCKVHKMKELESLVL